ncbi:MAG: hypothetical protein ACK5XN_18250 [Bacteroidota bacterium]
MATQYPNSLDVFTNPTATDTLNSGSVPHHLQHANINDAVEAMQTVLGLNPAGAHLTIKDRIIAAETSITNQSVLNGLTDVTITSASAGNVLRYNGSEWVNYSETNIVEGGNF